MCGHFACRCWSAGARIRATRGGGGGCCDLFGLWLLLLLFGKSAALRCRVGGDGGRRGGRVGPRSFEQLLLMLMLLKLRFGLDRFVRVVAARRLFFARPTRCCCCCCCCIRRCCRREWRCGCRVGCCGLFGVEYGVIAVEAVSMLAAAD